jgi:membrane protein implicated in regulation of membrane protease activity
MLLDAATFLLSAAFAAVALIGTVSALSMVGVPLGATVVGVVVAEAGLVAPLVGMGGIYLALAVAMILNPALRAMLGSSRDESTQPTAGDEVRILSRLAER